MPVKQPARWITVSLPFKGLFDLTVQKGKCSVVCCLDSGETNQSHIFRGRSVAELKREITEYSNSLIEKVFDSAVKFINYDETKGTVEYLVDVMYRPSNAVLDKKYLGLVKIIVTTEPKEMMKISLLLCPDHETGLKEMMKSACGVRQIKDAVKAKATINDWAQRAATLAVQTFRGDRAYPAIFVKETCLMASIVAERRIFVPAAS